MPEQNESAIQNENLQENTNQTNVKTEIIENNILHSTQDTSNMLQNEEDAIVTQSPKKQNTS